LDEYINRKHNIKHKCPICGMVFASAKGVNIHMARKHSPDIYLGEGVSVKHEGWFVELNIRMRRTLWRDIRLRAIEHRLPEDQLIFKVLSKLAAFGLDYDLWRDADEKLSYVS